MLLFDQNLSLHLTRRLADVFPGSQHVASVGLARASDQEVWSYAEEHDLMLVSKDADFGEMSLLYGFPPSVVWIRRGTCSTDEIEALLRSRAAQIIALRDDSDRGVLELR
jgi:predicted nuclease of predicted toxin-antitoxin system